MNSIGPMIAATVLHGVRYAERLLTGIAPTQFARLARNGDAPVQSNHPAFVYGHLSLYPAKVMAALGLPVGRAAPPAGYEALFAKDVACRDDVAGTLYPPMAEVTAFVAESYRCAIEVVQTTDDAVFNRLVPPDDRRRANFPTVGSSVNYFFGGHLFMHLGQVSAWRRMMGLPPA